MTNYSASIAYHPPAGTMPERIDHLTGFGTEIQALKAATNVALAHEYANSITTHQDVYDAYVGDYLPEAIATYDVKR